MAELISNLHSDVDTSIATYVPELTDSSNIQDALELFFYGQLSASANASSIYTFLLNSRDHINDSTGVHGITGSVVGTGGSQTLTDKTLTSPIINSGTLSGTFTLSSSATLTNNGTISGGTVNATTYQQSNTEGFLIPAGVILPYSGSATVAPDGWLFCYGQAVSRSTYSRLFSAFGTKYGIGDGSTTFNLPDIRGRVIAGRDDMGGTAASRITSAGSSIDGTSLGASGGSQFTQQHTHTMGTSGSHQHVLSLVEGDNIAGTGYFYYEENASGGSRTTANGDHTHTLANYGSGTSQNVQPTFILNYIIKY